jgi:hypothetical protein
VGNLTLLVPDISVLGRFPPALGADGGKPVMGPAAIDLADVHLDAPHGFLVGELTSALGAMLGIRLSIANSIKPDALWAVVGLLAHQGFEVGRYLVQATRFISHWRYGSRKRHGDALMVSVTQSDRAGRRIGSLGCSVLVSRLNGRHRRLELF